MNPAHTIEQEVVMRQLIVVCVLIFPALLHAQGTEAVEEARAYFLRGQEAYQEERWEDCARNFEHSFRTVFAPELLYNIGLCYERASHSLSGDDSVLLMERAVAAYTRYLRELPDTNDAVSVRASLADLRTLISRFRSQNEEPIADDPAPVEETPSYAESYLDLQLPPVIVSAPERVFGYRWTLTGASLTLASFVAALGTGIRSRLLFNRLASSCGQTAEGCSVDRIDRVSSLRQGASILYALSGVLLAATGVSFGLEVRRDNRELDAYVSLSRSF